VKKDSVRAPWRARRSYAGRDDYGIVFDRKPSVQTAHNPDVLTLGAVAPFVAVIGDHDDGLF